MINCFRFSFNFAFNFKLRRYTKAGPASAPPVSGDGTPAGPPAPGSAEAEAAAAAEDAAAAAEAVELEKDLTGRAFIHG
jgi:hypothetical protein